MECGHQNTPHAHGGTLAGASTTSPPEPVKVPSDPAAGHRQPRQFPGAARPPGRARTAPGPRRRAIPAAERAPVGRRAQAPGARGLDRHAPTPATRRAPAADCCTPCATRGSQPGGAPRRRRHHRSLPPASAPTPLTRWAARGPRTVRDDAAAAAAARRAPRRAARSATRSPARTAAASTTTRFEDARFDDAEFDGVGSTTGATTGTGGAVHGRRPCGTRTTPAAG